jgi:hypothetical protein
MKQNTTLHGRSVKGLVVAGALAALFAMLIQPAPASAHCDSTSGPVVGAARQALELGDPGPVLAYVQPAAEGELSAAFWQTLAVRQAGDQTQELADRYFFETAVRLHRLGEDASYTGLKEGAEVSPALAAAERALESGDVEAVSTLIERAVRLELDERYQTVVAARQRAAQEGGVPANRARAEAELAFEQYVDGVYQAALGRADHSAGAERPAAGDGH